MLFYNKNIESSQSNKYSFPKIKFIYCLLNFGITILFFILFVGCENKDRFYRPNLGEKLCCVSFINADDTSRFISFEKSYQLEYPTDGNDSLRNFSFSVSCMKREIFNFINTQPIKNLTRYTLPDSVEFKSGLNYNLVAQEKDSHDISAEITVPEPPNKPNLISVTRETTKLNDPSCVGWENGKIAVINITFENNIDQKLYYSLIVEGTGFSYRSTGVNRSGFLDFSVVESNSPGFFAVVHCINMFHYQCSENNLIQSPVSAYFLEGTKILNSSGRVTIAVRFSDNYCVYDVLKSIQIKLLSIPRELYLFEKSLYTYKVTHTDPFTEPIYLNGNIKGGNGIFAICRSRELSVEFSPWF